MAEGLASMTPGCPQVAVVGVGGAGVNAVSRLLDLGLGGLRYVAVDTSAQTLGRAMGARRLPLLGVTRGLGTGGDARLGQAAVRAAEPQLRSALVGAPVVLVVAGLAGGTGGGAGPELARLARGCGALTIGFGIRPFAFESPGRRRAAAEAEAAFVQACDLALPLDNERALALAGRELGLDPALRVADDLLRQAVQGLGSLLVGEGWIRVDLAHLRTLLGGGGAGWLALGLGRGEAPAQAAMVAALGSPLSDGQALGGARAALAQVSGGQDLAVADVAAAMALLRERLPADCALVVGAGLDPALSGAAQVMVMAAGTAAAEQAAAPWSGPAPRPPIPWPAPERPWRLGRDALREVG